MELKSGKNISLSNFLYSAKCGECGSELSSSEFEFRPDPDGSTYKVECHNCGQRYLATTSKVRIV